LWEEENVNMPGRRCPWDEDPYELRYDEDAGLFADDELEVVTVDYSKRRRMINLTQGHSVY